MLTAQLKEVTNSLSRTKGLSPNGNQSGRRANIAAPPLVHQSDKSVQTSRNSPRGHVQWTTEKCLESSMEERCSTAQSELLSSGVKTRSEQIPLMSRSGRGREQVHVYVHRQSSPIINPPRSATEGEGSSRLQVATHDEQQLDMSLASLKFTDSSLGETSLHQVLQRVERELSSSDNDRDVPIVRHSTPEPPTITVDSKKASRLSSQGVDESKTLRLVGNKVVPQENKGHIKMHVRSQVAGQTSRSRTQNRLSSLSRPRIRNYNIRD